MIYIDTTSPFALKYKIAEKSAKYVRVKQIKNEETYWFTIVEFERYFQAVQ